MRDRSTLTVMAEVAILVLAVASVGSSALELVRSWTAAATKPRALHMASTAYANAGGAHFIFTNEDGFSKYACVRATLANKEGKTLTSLPVCTGEVKPFSTVVLESEFMGGNVDDVCFKETDFGKQLDWSRCTFDTEDVTEKPHG